MLNETTQPLNGRVLPPVLAIGPVAGLLAEVLGHEPAPDRPLRDCGLDSIAAARLRAELDQRFGVLVPMAELSRCHGPADLVRLLTAAGGGPARAAARAAGGQGPRPARDDAARFEPFDLTTIQQAYLVGKDRDFTGDPVGCHLYREFQVADADTGRLRSAWERVVAEHDMLRTVVTDDGRQRVLAEVPACAVPVHQGGDPLTTRERLSYRRYDPARWPLFDVEVTLRPDQPATVHLSLDALLTDGPGLDYLLESWWRYYLDPGAPAGAAQPFPRDCLRWLHEQGAAARPGDLAHWEGRLAALPPGPAVTVTPEPSEDGYRRTPLDDELDAAQWAALQRRAAGLGVSVSALVLAVFATALRAHSRAGQNGTDERPAVPSGAFSLVLTTNQRGRLPGGATGVIAPFTATAVVAVDDPAERGLADLARTLHDRLWEDLDHQSVSATDALRGMRGADAVPLPVVFTSLLDAGRQVPPGSFGDSVSYALSQTSGVAIDCQVGAAGGRLQVHWDVTEAMLPPGLAPVLFAQFMNRLVGCGLEPGAHVRPLNELQQAYHVARAGGPAPWDGCQVYQAIEVADLDLPRLAAAWAGLMRDHEPLRSYATADGEILALPAWPAGWRIPETTGDGDGDPGRDLGRELVARAFPLDSWPAFDLRVTRRGGRPAIVHLTLDLLLLDGRSTHLLARELLARYAGHPVRNPARPAAAAAPAAAAVADAERHWLERAAALPPGPPLRPCDSAASKARTRRHAVIANWPAIRERLQAAGIGPDAALAAALNTALAPEFSEPFATTLVRWTADTEPARPAEHTRLSWLPGGPGDYWPLARDLQRTIEQDTAADGASGLAQLRRAVLRRRGGADPGYAVVHTGLLELAGQPWPAGTRLLGWATCTPDVALDCIAMDEGDGVLRVFWDAVEDQFVPGQLARVFDRYVAALRALGEPAAGPASAAAPPEPDPAGGLSPGERDAVLRSWNDTGRPYTADGPVHLLFERRAAATPAATAVRWRDGTLSYRDLNRWANAIAARLRRPDWTGTPVVAVSTRRGPEMIAAVLGVLKAGAAYLPVDPTLPAERARGMIADAGAVAVLTSAGERSWTPPDALPILAVDSDEEIGRARAAGTAADVNPPASASADSLAYVIYTSGSTGRPKGVAVTHRPVHNLLQWAARLFRFTPGDIGLSVTSLGFDLSVFDIFGLLGYGASLYVADSEEQADPGLLLDILLEQRITFWNSAPTTLDQLAPLLPAASERTRALRLVFLSGDWTPLTLPPALRAAFPRLLLVSLGGATEATVWSNYFPVVQVEADWRSVPYGRPIDNSRYYVLDSGLQPCRPGQEGDLYIAGTCLSAGYRGRPGLTAERFVADPFAAEGGGRPGERMYRTGDRACYTADGTMIFRGRLDSQVKIRGFRVELGEVEHRLRAHPDVLDVVALARDDPDGNKVLVAYVRPAGAAVDGPALRRHAALTLPGYMVPSHVVLVDSFPATSNGKLDRNALPAPGTLRDGPPPARPDLPAGSPDLPPAPPIPPALPAPRSPLTPPVPSISPAPHSLLGPPALPAPLASAALSSPAPPAPPARTAPPVRLAELTAEVAALFRTHIGAGELDTSADLWDQGATSFTMVRVSAALKKRYRERIPVSALLETPTINGIARAVAAVVNPQAPGTVPAGTVPAGAVLPDAVLPDAVLPDAVLPAAMLPEAVPAEAVPSGAVPSGAVPSGEAPSAADPAPEVDLLDERARAEFLRARRNRRPARGDARATALPRGGVPDQDYDRAAVHRTFTEGPVPLSALAALLELLSQEGGEGGRYRYPSAGRTYAVQAYLQVREAGVAGLEAGVYYYRPDTHSLELVSDGTAINRRSQFFYNRELYDRAAFQIFLVGESQAIEPLYGTDAQLFLAVEAGYIGQLLLQHQAELGIGLCPIGTVAFDRIRPALGLQESHWFLHAFLGGPLAPAASADPPATLRDKTAPAVTTGERPDTAAAVTGLAGRFASCADLDEFWELLSEGRTAFRDWPRSREPVDPGLAPAGGYLDSVVPADPLRFGISPAEASTLDPQLWLVLDAARGCIEDAGLTPDTLRAAGRVGVFVATMWPDGQTRGADDWRAGRPALQSGIAADLPNRVSHSLGFRGPSVAVNTSCSSALTALHLARASLARGECDAALVAAVNVIAHPYHLALLGGLDLLAGRPVGAFGADAAGWTPGEGAGAVLLRPEAAARASGDPVQAVIESSWTGHAGPTQRFGAPSAAALRDCLRDGLRAAGLRPSDIGYVECAAAGAPLADAAEVEALGEVFAAGPGPVSFGTVKPNIGHLEAASGLSQLAKVVLQLREGMIAPTLAAAERSPLVCWDPAVLRLASTAAAWTGSGPGQPRRALVNALGATGSYAHLVVREPGTGGRP